MISRSSSNALFEGCFNDLKKASTSADFRCPNLDLGTWDLRLRAPVGLAALAGSQPVSSHWLGHEPFGEARDQRPCTRDGLLYRGKRQGGLMARLVSPGFGDPDRVSI
jgi:hypothetical protein